MKHSFALLFALLACLFGSSTTARALSWTPGWNLPLAANAREVSAAERVQARQLGDTIDSPASARTAIQAWETIATAQPDSPEAWIEIGSLRLLEGAAYRKHTKERLACYLAGIQACERAMATHPEFLRRVKKGEPAWAAATALGPREMGAMNFWATGIFYIFRDCLGFFGRMANVNLMEKGAKGMLAHMDAVDLGWEEHASTFSWGIYYLVMPSSRGGDKARARACFERAVTLGVHRTLPRWGRGKYFYVAMGETAASRADLAAVAARDLDALDGNRSWNRYFKVEAAALLAK